jgi:hypothetical protein
MDLAARAEAPDDSRRPIDSGRPTYLLAFTVGALVGAGLAAIWIPERPRRRLPAIASRRYRRVRRASVTALDEIREAGREIAGELREELAATLEAAREEFGHMARGQLEQARRALRRERRVATG